MTDWMWPVATACSSALVGVSGVIATYRSGHRQTHTALEIARQNTDNDFRLLVEERRLTRTTAAYTELMAQLFVVRGWVSSVFDRSASKYEMPEYPVEAVTAQSDAAVQLGWTAPVQDLYGGWLASVERFVSAATYLSGVHQGRKNPAEEGRSVEEVRATVESRRADVLAAERALRDAMWKELNAPPGG